ncbi:MAG: hypothetical protein ACP5OP_03450 [Leptospirillia bacterium]
MKGREQELKAKVPSVAPQIFRVWVDEGGQVRLPEEHHGVIPEEFFVEVDTRESARHNPYILLSAPDGPFFARSSPRADRYFSLSGDQEFPLDFPVIFLGGVVRGSEWFTLEI